MEKVASDANVGNEKFPEAEEIQEDPKSRKSWEKRRSRRREEPPVGWIRRMQFQGILGVDPELETVGSVPKDSQKPGKIPLGRGGK